jgi:hypothetical protein
LEDAEDGAGGVISGGGEVTGGLVGRKGIQAKVRPIARRGHIDGLERCGVLGTEWDEGDWGHENKIPVRGKGGNNGEA